MELSEIKNNIINLARTFAREIGLVFRFHPKQSAALAFFQIIIGVIPAGILFATAEIVTIVAKQEGFWTEKLWEWLIIVIVLLGIQRIFFQLQGYFQERLMNLLYLSVNDRIHQKIVSLDLPTLEKSETQAMIAFFRDQSFRPYNMVRTVFNEIENSVASISFIIIAWKFSPFLITLFIVALIPSIVVAVKASLASQHMTWGKSFFIKRSFYIQNLFLGVASMTEFLVHGAAGKMANKYKELYGEVVEKERQVGVKKLVAGFLTNFLAFAVYIWAYIILVGQAISGIFSIGAFTLYAGAFVSVERFLVNQVWQIAFLFEHIVYLEKFQELETMQAKIKNLSDAVELTDERLKIEFKNVCYQYSDSTKLALDNVSFVIEPGDRVALVGENGAGKTTLVKLLLRLYEPTSGEILINGQDIRKYTLESLRRRIAVTFQNFLKLALSAKDNIGLGLGEGEASEAQAIEAARRSGAHDKISGLPKSYNTCLGRGWEDDGVELSGGEWQKVALARSLIKDASLLVLDEPTAALDARSEFIFFKSFFVANVKFHYF